MSDVAEVAEETTESSAKAAGRSRLVKAAILVLTTVGIVGGGAAGIWLLGPPGFIGSANDPGASGIPKPAVFYTLPEITINLSNAESRTQYLKLEIDLEYESRAYTAIINQNMARILDAFQIYLRELRVSDLEGSAGLFMLKEELRRRINKAIYPARINQVLFRTILIQ